MRNTQENELSEINNPKLSFGIKFGYGIGDIGSNFFIITTGMFLLFFLTNVVGIEPALAGLVLLVAKLWDVISDPIMEGISDATHSKMGRRRSYLLFGAIPFGLSLFILFIVPEYNSEILKAVHVGIMFIIACTAFIVINVPYSSMVAEMSDDYNERMSITSFRMIFASIGALTAGGLAMPLVKWVVEEKMVLSTLICFRATYKYNLTEENFEKLKKDINKSRIK